MTTLLVLGAGIEAIPGLQRARAMGLHIVATDGNTDAPGRAHVDDFLHVSTYDATATMQAAWRYHTTVRRIHGAIALAADVPMTVAKVAQLLGLPGPSIETGMLTSDKLLMKHRLHEDGVPIPWYAAVHSVAMLEGYVKQYGIPLVLKPVDSRGARGVLRLTPDVDLSWAYAYSQQFSPTGRVMVEEYLQGPQISTESVLHDGWAVTPGVIDRNYSMLDAYAPHMVEDGGEEPSVLSAADQAAVCAVAERAALALGITNGTAKGDLVWTNDGPKVIEIASRLSGGYMSSVQIPLSTGVDLVGIAIRLAMGESVTQEEATPQRHDGVCIRYLWPTPGHIVSIIGVDEAQVLPGVQRLDLAVAVGGIVDPVTNHTQRAGSVITTGATRDEAVTRAEAAVQLVRITTENSLGAS